MYKLGDQVTKRTRIMHVKGGDMENLKKILEEISLDQMMDRIHYMTENFPTDFQAVKRRKKLHGM